MYQFIIVLNGIELGFLYIDVALGRAAISHSLRGVSSALIFTVNGNEDQELPPLNPCGRTEGFFSIFPQTIKHQQVAGGQAIFEQKCMFCQILSTKKVRLWIK